jgi:hypothetical protein
MLEFNAHFKVLKGHKLKQIMVFEGGAFGR